MIEKNPKKINLNRKFLHYLIPSVSAMWVFSIYTMIDGIFVGKFVGPTALASINISMPFISFNFACALLFAVGASTVISIYLGKSKKKNADEIFTSTLVIITIFSIIILLLAHFNLDSLSYFLGADSTTISSVKDYLRIIIFFNGFFMVSYYLEVLCKTDGSPYLSTIGVVSSSLCNIILDYIFVVKLNYGVAGAAFATGISQVLSTIIFFSYFFSKKSKLNLVKFKINLKELIRMIKIGFPDSITELSAGIIILLFNQVILRFIGETGIVAYSVISYVNNLVLMTMLGISQGMQPLVSFYYGRNDKASIKKLFKLSLITVAITSFLAFFVSMIFSNFIVSVFLDSNNYHLFDFTDSSFKAYSFTFILMGFNVLIAGFCSALEKPKYASIISLGRGLFIVTFSLFIMTTLFGSKGIWISTAISEAICLVISLIILKKKLLNSHLKIDIKKIV
ncbi:MAG: MATE family efflux transporter [Sarcina sp.]